MAKAFSAARKHRKAELWLEAGLEDGGARQSDTVLYFPSIKTAYSDHIAANVISQFSRLRGTS